MSVINLNLDSMFGGDCFKTIVEKDEVFNVSNIRSYVKVENFMKG